MNKKYRVEIFVKNVWAILSYHNNMNNAVVNAEVHSKSRHCDARVIHEGNIIFKNDYQKEG